MTKDKAWGYVYTPSGGRRLAFVTKEDRPLCMLCGRPAVHRHHVFFGTANRKQSERYGMVAWLCRECHQGQKGVHNNRQADLSLKREFQTIFEQNHSKDEFIRLFGKNFL